MIDFMDKDKRYIYIGLAIWLLTHVYILIAGMPQDQVKAHAVINLVGFLILMASKKFRRLL